MNNFKFLFYFFSFLILFVSCSSDEDEIDCNLVENGPAMIDDCGDCQQALIYDYVTHQSEFIDDTIDVNLGPTEMIVMPNSTQNPFWNSGCNSILGSINEFDASDWILDMSQGPNNPTATGPFVKFSFSEGGEVLGDNWDVAFRGPTIIVNGGEGSSIDQPERTGNAAVYIANGTMNEIQSVDMSSLLQDSESGTAIVDDLGFTGQGWCSYDMMTHIISPIAGRILVFRTHNNNYAKMEILNFYDNPMTSQYGGFYTFNYVYDTNFNFDNSTE